VKITIRTLVACLIGLSLFADVRVKFAIGEWEPYTGHQLECFGMTAEIVTAACHAGGIEAEYEFFPWRRAESCVEEGTSFATFPYQGTKERAAKYYFSEIICKSSNGILLHKGNPRTSDFTYSTPETLKGFKVGIIAGGDAVKLPLQKIGSDVEEVQNVDQNIMKLESNRLDCVIEDKPVLYQALKKVYGSDLDKLNQFQFVERGFGETTEYRLLVSRKYPNSKDLLEKFNAGLRKIKVSGRYQKILKKYGM
jgi:polar amino acid transport system substrate-binding protein